MRISDWSSDVCSSDLQTIGEVDPGDAFRLSFGMAYSINERSSFTLGYKHDFIDETETEVNGVDLTAPSLSVGSLLLGYSFQVNDYASTNINLELEIGSASCRERVCQYV